MHKTLKLIFVSFFLVALLIGIVSAAKFDNIQKDITFTKYSKITIGEKEIPYNEIWDKYSPIEINNLFGFGETLWGGAITQHTDYCGIDCSSTIEISLANDGVLIDDVIFKTLQSDGSWIEQDVRNYQFYVNDIPYELGTEMNAGNYEVKLDAQKKPSRTVDWIIKTNGEWLESWATWGNISEGDDAEVILNSPVDDSTAYFFNNTFNATANVTGGAVILNMSLFNNESGSWEIKNTTLINNLTGYRLSEYRFEESSGDLLDNTGSYNLTTVSGVTRQQTGIIDFAYNFDGNNDYITGTSFDPEVYSTLSFNVWVFLDNSSGGMIFRYPETGSWGNVHLEVESSTSLSFVFGCGSSTCAGGGSPLHSGISISNINDGNWHMLTTTHGDGDRIYLDGVSIGNFSQGGLVNTGTDLFIGNNDASPGDVFNGTIDEFTSYNKVLNLHDIQSLYKSGLALRPINGSFSTQTWNRTIADDIIWNVQACDSDGDCGFATSNFTLLLDTIAPTIDITSPNETFILLSIGDSLDLNFTITDVNVDKCWYNYNGTNITTSCTTNTTFLQEANNFNLTLYTNDTLGNENSSITSWDFTLFENSLSYNNQSYETKSETFYANITTNGTAPTNARLMYNNLPYTATITNTVGDDYNLSSTIQILEGVGNKTFYFNFTIGDIVINTTSNNQTVNLTEFALCNATNNNQTVRFINYTFRDEETGGNVSSTIDTSTFTYWLGDGSVSKELIYSNATASNNQSFCFKPGTETMLSNRTVQYSATGYPQRRSYETTDLTNITTSRILYLLSSAEGIYSTFQVLDSNGQALAGVQVLAERQFVGVWTTIGNDNTDDSGAVTFWLNPDFDHRFTFVQTGCTTQTFSVRPTQTNYLITMSCAETTNVTSIYASAVEGIRYNHYPASGVLSPGIYNFSYIVESDRDNIDGALFRIINTSNSVVLMQNSSVCTSSGCLLWGNYTVIDGSQIKGLYYVDVGSGYLLLEGDAFWITINSTVSDFGTIKDFMLNFNNFFDTWNAEDVDVSNRKEFTKFVFIFFFFCIFYAFFNKFTGYDGANPGMVIYFITAFILIGSMAGGTSCANQGCQGLFYYGNLFGQTASERSGFAAGFLNNYILVMVILFIAGGHLLSVMRRNS